MQNQKKIHLQIQKENLRLLKAIKSSKGTIDFKEIRQDEKVNNNRKATISYFPPILDSNSSSNRSQSRYQIQDGISLEEHTKNYYRNSSIRVQETSSDKYYEETDQNDDYLIKLNPVETNQ